MSTDVACEGPKKRKVPPPLDGEAEEYNDGMPIPLLSVPALPLDFTEAWWWEDQDAGGHRQHHASLLPAALTTTHHVLPPPSPPPSSPALPPPTLPAGWLHAVPTPRLGAGNAHLASAPFRLGQCLYTRFMAMTHALGAFTRKSLTVLRAFALCTRDVASDVYELRPSLDRMSQAMGCSYEALLYDQNLIRDLHTLGGALATRKQKRVLEARVCDPFVTDLYNAGAPSLLMILSNGQKRICGNDLFQKKYLVHDGDGNNLSALELLERIIAPEDLEDFVGCVLDMLFCSSNTNSTGEAATILKCLDNQTPPDRHLVLARLRFLVSDAGEYLVVVLSFQALPATHKYLVGVPQAQPMTPGRMGRGEAGEGEGGGGDKGETVIHV